jgi:hypothetical protein
VEAGGFISSILLAAYAHGVAIKRLAALAGRLISTRDRQ